ncbi:hypothetical protein FGO68_gene4328 [Halteria grandinella]|uniref:Uncharacterized protein n=1 Tax=Halteria grandinella TaxID=5974 RepID=A0A8J8NGW0_HALGN|nr:hypothetical protein FGO68_gene4328 [Halteria grandinella]
MPHHSLEEQLGCSFRKRSCGIHNSTHNYKREQITLMIIDGWLKLSAKLFIKWNMPPPLGFVQQLLNLYLSFNLSLLIKNGSQLSFIQ